MRIKYHGAFSEFLGETTKLRFDYYPLDAEIIDGFVPVFKFSAGGEARFSPASRSHFFMALSRQ